MIFTSNKNPALWREDFEEDATLLCTLDRIFDDATVFKLRGESFRGKKLETISLQTEKMPAIELVVTKEKLICECSVVVTLLFILLARGFADKDWLNAPDKIWSQSPGANNCPFYCFSSDTAAFLTI